MAPDTSIAAIDLRPQTTDHSQGVITGIFMDGVTRCQALLHSVLLCTVLSACASVPADKGVDTPDPLESMNRGFFAFNNVLDKAIFGPVSRGYAKVTPEPAQTGIRNFFDNLQYLETIINDFLQGKIEDGMEDSLRVIINTTFGLGGLNDFAGGIGFPRRDEDYGQTLAVWGVGPGIYLELPFFGPRTLRDGAVIPLSMVSRPLFYADTAVSLSAFALDTVDVRARLESAIRLRDETALDPYIFQRDAWLQRRRNLIFDGNPPPEDLEFFAPPPQ
jgi:phospholipid-binding lipoprotein MlaA